MTKPVTRLLFFLHFFVLSAASAGWANETIIANRANANGLVSISINDVSASESDGSIVFTVTLSETPTSNVSVNYSTSNGSATAGEDYSSKSGTLTIPTGLTSGTISINLINDSIDENSETFNVNLSNPSANASIQDGQGRGTITDNDGPPSISIGDASGDEDDGTVSFNVSLSTASGKDIDVDYSTSDGSATSGSDYTAKSGTVFISAGSTSGSITIALIDDGIDEFDESFTVELSNPSNANLADDTATGTIRDNDSQPSLSVNDASADEGDGSMSFTVTLSKTSGKQVKVDYKTSNGTATAGSDFINKSGTLTFSPGTTSQNFSVSIIDDSDDEDDENFNIELSNQQNASISDGNGQGTIRDNDLPSLSIDDPSVPEDGGPMIFTVSLSRPSTVPVAVQYATNDGSATSGDDYTGTSGNLTIPAGMASNTILVSLVNDDDYENAENFTVTLSNPTNATIKDNSGTGTIQNDDVPALSINDVSKNEADGTATFTVNLSMTIPDAATVDFATRDSTATAGDDYTAQSGKLTFNSGTTSLSVTIDITNDTADEDDEYFLLELSNPSNATIADGQGIGTIVDNDVTPAVSISDVSGIEGSGSMTFAVSLSTASPNTVTVGYRTADSSARAGQDFVTRSGSLTFSPGSTSESVTINLIDDSLDEGTEIFAVVLSNPVNATIADGLGTGQIQDNDDPPALSIDDVTVQEPATNTTTMFFTVSLSAASGRTVSFDFASTDSTATSPADFLAASGSETIAAGDTSAQIIVVVESDTLAEIDEVLHVKISNVVNATLADAIGRGTILGELSLSVVLENFEAKTGSKFVELSWETSSETENVGFHVLRSTSPDTGFQQINPNLLPGAGTTTATQSYAFADTSAQSGVTYYYQLISIHSDGSEYGHPPIDLSVGPFTSIADDGRDLTPASFHLEQNFPNPFNPETVISFTLSGTSSVTLRIYSLEGRLVRTLVSGKIAAGTHRVVWDATDSNGRQVASGAYLYVLKSERFVSQRKLLFLK